ncbi:MAG: right-handed parallel beta-helix repeat-containing protein [Sphingomonadales bacterium]
MKMLLAVLLAAGAAAGAWAQAGEAPFVIKESGRGFGTLQDAVDTIGGGAGTILIAPGRYRQCAVQEAGGISYVAVQPGAAVFDGVACEGKAALVLGGRSALVEGLTFEHLAVADGNGAGIRLERGDLMVSETSFRDSQSGILSHDDPSGTIRIEHSTFSGLGFCGDDCAHSIYIGNYGRMIVSRVRFERGTGGHYVKSRGARVDISDSSFDDSAGRATNYMIDLSNGGAGTIERNLFVQGANKENYSALIVVAAEGARHSSSGLTIANNDASLAPGAKPTTFIVDFTGERLAIGGNRLGSGVAPFERR